MFLLVMQLVFCPIFSGLVVAGSHVDTEKTQYGLWCFAFAFLSDQVIKVFGLLFLGCCYAYTSVQKFGVT